jgi:hypothetical protein
VSNGKDQTAKLWDLRKMYSSAAFARLPQPEDRFAFDYRWMAYPGDGAPPSRHPHDASVMTYRGHTVLQTLVRAYFSPAETTGQRYIVSGSADGAVFIFDVLTGDIHSVLRGHSAAVRDVAWHPASPQLVSGSWDGRVSVWGYGEEEAAEQRERRAGRHRNRERVAARNHASAGDGTSARRAARGAASEASDDGTADSAEDEEDEEWRPRRMLAARAAPAPAAAEATSAATKSAGASLEPDGLFVVRAAPGGAGPVGGRPGPAASSDDDDDDEEEDENYEGEGESDSEEDEDEEGGEGEDNEGVDESSDSQDA